MTISLQSLATTSAIENPIYFSAEFRDRLQVIVGLTPRNITGVFFHEMTFNSQRNILAFALEVIWKPPIYQNITGVFQEYIGTQRSRISGSEIQPEQVRNQLTIIEEIPLIRGKRVAEISFSGVEISQDSKGITFLRFDIPIRLEPSFEEPAREEITRDSAKLNLDIVPSEISGGRDLYKASSEPALFRSVSEVPMYEEIVSGARKASDKSVPPEVNMQTHPANQRQPAKQLYDSVELIRSLPFEINMERALRRSSSEPALLNFILEASIKKSPTYEEIVFGDAQAGYRSVAPEVNMQTHPANKRHSSKQLTERVTRFFSNLFRGEYLKRNSMRSHDHVYQEIKKRKT